MIIAGFERCSLIDYPGKLAAVVFTGGCNFRCCFCHNRPHLVESASASDGTEINDVYSFLRRRRGMLDAVVVSGGEPTIQDGLEDLLRRFSRLGFLVKLDTNGSRPEVVRRILHRRLVNYIAMDLKAPPQLLPQIVGVDVDLLRIHESIRLIMDGGIEYEFRTTVLPQFTTKDILEIGRSIQGARRYVLQHYRTPAFLRLEAIGGRPMTEPCLCSMTEVGHLTKGWFGELLYRDFQETWPHFPLPSAEAEAPDSMNKYPA